MSNIWLFLKTKFIPVVLSLVFVALAILHSLYPGVVPDAITLGLLFFALLPWIAGNANVKSIEFLGLKFELEVKEVIKTLQKETADNKPGIETEPQAKKIGRIQNSMPDKTNVVQNPSDVSNEPVKQAIPLNRDIYIYSNMSLIDLGNEVERRLRLTADKHNIKSTGSMRSIINPLIHEKVITDEVASAFLNIMSWRNQAAHEISVTPVVAQQINQVRELTLKYLSRLD